MPKLADETAVMLSAQKTIHSPSRKYGLTKSGSNGTLSTKDLRNILNGSVDKKKTANMNILENEIQRHLN